jgi:hypothetical protein
MQFKVYKSNKSYDEISQALLNMELKAHPFCGTEKYASYLIDHVEYLKYGEFKIPNPVRFNICITKSDNPLVIIELIRTLSNEILDNIVKSLNLKEIFLQKKDMLHIFNTHVMKLLRIYVRTKQGNQSEIESKREADARMNDISEILAISFIPNINDCDVYPIITIKKEGIFITDMDYESSIKFIDNIIGDVK